jgi:hypothetical protein
MNFTPMISQNDALTFTQQDRERMVRTELNTEVLQKQIDELKVLSSQNKSEIMNLLLWGFGIVFAGIFTLVGFILWDRRTFIKPFQIRVDEVEKKLESGETQNQSMIKALRDLAKTDVKLAEILKTHNLL